MEEDKASLEDSRQICCTVDLYFTSFPTENCGFEAVSQHHFC